MIDVSKKIEKIEKNCIDTAKKELALLKDENDKISEEKILEKVNNYKTELAEKYQEEINKLKREFNRNIFDYEIEGKKKVSQKREECIEKIENRIVEEFKNFVNTPEYENFLETRIAETKTLEIYFEETDYTIFITENDYNKYYEKILNNELLGQDMNSKSNITIEKISNSYIGGCIILDRKNNISIDNTIRTDISQKIKEINI